MPTDGAQDDLDDSFDESDDEGEDDWEDDADEASPLTAGAKRLRDGPLWIGLAPLLILGAAVLASTSGSVALTLTILFIGAAIWGVVVWRFARDR